MIGRRALAASLLVSAAILTIGPARATALSDSAIFGQFNAIIFGNDSATSEVEGRTAIGGNLTAGTNFEIKTGLASSSYGALSVYGNVTDTGTLNIDNGGIAIAGSNTANYDLNGGSAYVGGGNTGNLAASGGTASLSVIGANSGALSLSSGGSVFVGNGNTGGITVNGGSTTIGINGNTSNTLSLNNGSVMSLNGGNNGTISLNGGSLTYTGSEGTVTNINGGTVTQVSSLNLTAPTSTLGAFATTFQTPLTALSGQLNGVAANSTASQSSGVVSFNATPNASGVAVFDVNTSLFSGASSVTFNLDGATSVIINVTVSGCASGNCVFAPGNLNFTQGPVQGSTDYASMVLWNFVNASALDLTSEFVGSVLAPGAAVTNTSPIDGTLVAASDTSSSTGELHSYSYTGAFPGTAAPEPASLAIIATGLAGLTAIRRRGRVKA